MNTIFRACIEDNNDPLRLDRVRIRVQGVHSPIQDEVDTTNLPWSLVMGSNFSGNGIGDSSIPIIGTWVYCIPLNESYSEFLVIGSMKGRIGNPDKTNSEGLLTGFRDKDSRYDEVKYESASNPLTYGEDIRNDKQGSFSQVDQSNIQEKTLVETVYPNNKVYYDQKQNLIEIDATEGVERIRIQHHKGTRIEIDKNGSVVIHSNTNIGIKTDGLLSINAVGNMSVEGNLKVNGNIETTKTITANSNITSKANVADSKGNLSSLRSIFNSHEHVYMKPEHPSGTTDTQSHPSDPQQRTEDFGWTKVEL